MEIPCFGQAAAFARMNMLIREAKLDHIRPHYEIPATGFLWLSCVAPA